MVESGHKFNNWFGLGMPQGQPLSPGFQIPKFLQSHKSIIII